MAVYREKLTSHKIALTKGLWSDVNNEICDPKIQKKTDIIRLMVEMPPNNLTHKHSGLNFGPLLNTKSTGFFSLPHVIISQSINTNHLSQHSTVG